MEKEKPLFKPSKDYPSKSDKIAAKVADVLNPTIAIIDAAAAGGGLVSGHESAAIVYGILSLFFTGITVSRTINVRKEKDDLQVQIESQKTPVKDDFEKFG